jgi:hypothetical protein
MRRVGRARVSLERVRSVRDGWVGMGRARTGRVGWEWVGWGWVDRRRVGRERVGREKVAADPPSFNWFNIVPLIMEFTFPRWSPVQSVEKILLSVVSMLAEPNDERSVPCSDRLSKITTLLIYTEKF